MATQTVRTKTRADPGTVTDSRGNMRIYTDVPAHIGKEFKVLAIRRNTSIRALMAQLIMDAVNGK